MRYVADALDRARRPAGPGAALDGAQHALRRRPVRPLPAARVPRLRRRPGLRARPGAAAARHEGAVMDLEDPRRARSWPSGSSPAATAASSPCSTARTSCSGSPVRSRSPTSRRRRGPWSRAPTTSPSSRARSPRPDDLQRIQEVRAASRRLVTIGACATAGGIQALRNFADVAEFTAAVYAHPEYIATLDRSTPISAHVEVDFELRGCPIDRAQLLEVIAAFLHRRRPRAPRRERVHGVQAARQHLRHRRARDALPRSGHPCRVRRAVPVVRPRVLRVLRAGRDGQHARPWHGGCASSACPSATWHASSARSTPPRPPSPRRAPATQRADGGRHDAQDPRRRSRVHRRRPWPGSRARARCGSCVEDGTVTDVQLRIYEPPRFFEALLRGRAHTEPPDITSRICGICPVAYEMSACLAIEDACGVVGARRGPAAAAAAVLRRVDREPRAARLPAAPARLPRLPGRGRDERRTTPTWSSAGCG